MTTSLHDTAFVDPAPAQRLERTAAALVANGFTVEVLDDVAAARARIKELIPEGAEVFTGASETLRLSGIDEDINAGGRYRASRPRLLAMDRATQMDDIRRLSATPDVIVGSVQAVTETGSLVVASGSGSQLPGYAGGAARAIWIVGAQKVVPDLSTALRRIEDHCLPLESARTQAAYGSPSAINRLSSSTPNFVPDAAPSCSSAKPSASEPAPCVRSRGTVLAGAG
ncbi:LUD domain-containing protein [Actinomadura bangladeshensis]|uniref:LUD domain-containing protein n=1 Tax=Actinomadura bangladeshensis TaxID=453573 RepID=UPI001A9CC164|nr:LUD domain-containing protein [Actinomadura bangladeshensis]